MYKTVRHGENSLQYKILAQQEDGGIPSVKRRRSNRGKTTGIIIIIVLLLICGVIATAVLVPLVLTNDFITLTGTFQKFSVSTLRRSHAGNHVMVIAKKPHGWNSSRQSVLLLPTKATVASQQMYLLNNKTKHTTIPSVELTTAFETPVAYTTTTAASTTHRDRTATVTSVSPDRATEPEKEKIFTTKKISQAISRTDGPLITEKKLVSTPEPNQSQGESHAGPEVVANSHEISSSPTSSWYHTNRKWNFEAPSFINWSKNRISNDSLSTAVGGMCAVSVIIIIIIVLVKSLPDRKRTVEKESADTKEDKKRLLKPSARTSDEE